MRSILDFFIRYYAFFLFLLLEGIALFYTISHSQTKTERFLSSAGFISGYWYKQTHAVSEYFKLSELNRKLSAENTHLQNQLSAYDAFSHKSNEILEEHQYTYTLGRIIKNSVNHHNNYLTLDKGIADGIKENNAVVSPNGIVGVVAKVSEHYATVVPLLNSNFQITGVIKKNGYFGTVSWDGLSPEYLTLDDIPGHIDIRKGDTVVSSRYSSVFPEGIPVGVVDQLYKIKQNNFYKLKIKTAVDFRRLNYVYVIENKLKHERDSIEQLTEEEFRFTE